MIILVAVGTGRPRRCRAASGPRNQHARRLDRGRLRSGRGDRPAPRPARRHHPADVPPSRTRTRPPTSGRLAGPPRFERDRRPTRGATRDHRSDGVPPAYYGRRLPDEAGRSLPTRRHQPRQVVVIGTTVVPTSSARHQPGRPAGPVQRHTLEVIGVLAKGVHRLPRSRRHRDAPYTADQEELTGSTTPTAAGGPGESRPGPRRAAQAEIPRTLAAAPTHRADLPFNVLNQASLLRRHRPPRTHSPCSSARSPPSACSSAASG